MNTFVQTQFEGNRAGLKDILPLRDKITPETFERERDKIFKKSWLMIGHVADLPETGSYFVREVRSSTSLIVIRGRDGAIRSFHNVCRHRGNKLIRGGGGCKSTITCGFHGWTWSNTGELLGSPRASSTISTSPRSACWRSRPRPAGLHLCNFDPAAGVARGLAWRTRARL
jgi:phenylpropionate dioxygenase-like ring-hydroxylating dioxygenase large terminal subunit